jgi:hypothetical protein
MPEKRYRPATPNSVSARAGDNDWVLLSGNAPALAAPGAASPAGATPAVSAGVDLRTAIRPQGAPAALPTAAAHTGGATPRQP